MRHAELGRLAALAVRSSIQLLVVIAAFGTNAVVRAQDDAQVQDWPRFHIGAAFGDSDLTWDWSQSGLPERFWTDETMEPASVRKLVGGYRPLRVVGMEIQYVDFDNTELRARGRALFGGGQVPVVYNQTSFMEAGAEAWVLSALLFIPEPFPLWDVYGKVGVAELEESFTASATTVDCTPLNAVGCRNTIRSDSHQSDVVPDVGIGARFKVARQVAFRIEYEAIGRDVGDNSSMLSLGFAWEH